MTDEIPLLEVKDLQKYYEDGYHAVKGVSYKIGSGLLVGLIGPNGCGKTTMMKCINSTNFSPSTVRVKTLLPKPR